MTCHYRILQTFISVTLRVINFVLLLRILHFDTSSTVHTIPQYTPISRMSTTVPS